LNTTHLVVVQRHGLEKTAFKGVPITFKKAFNGQPNGHVCVCPGHMDYDQRMGNIVGRF